MKNKALPVSIVILIIFSGLNVVATDSDNEITTNESVLNEKISFSPEVIKSKGEYISIDIAETNTFLRNAEKPMLPIYVRTYTFPRGTKIQNVECTLSEIRTETIASKIQPAPRPIPRNSLQNTEVKNDIIEDQEVYSSSEIYPDKWYDYEIGCGLDKGEDVIFLKVACYPVRYSPLENTVYYAEKADIQITYEETVTQKKLNGGYELVIIAPRRFRLTLFPLLFHKIKNGVTTKIKTTESIYREYEGRDKPEQIKKFIKYAKDNWDTKYILLVGGLKSYFNAEDKDDSNQGSSAWHLPVRYVNHYEGYISDLYYSDLYRWNNTNQQWEFEDWDSNGNNLFLDGDWYDNESVDLYPDVYYGRLPCRNILEVMIVVKKIIDYEKTYHMDETWFKRTMAAGGVTTNYWYEGQPDGEWLCNLSIDYLGDYVEDAVKIYASNTGKPRPVPLDIIEQFSRGAGFLLLQGHGNSFMWDTHWPNTRGNWTGGILQFLFPLITNDEKFPIMVVGGCHNAQFNVTFIKGLTDDPDDLYSHYHTYGVPIISCFSWNIVKKPNGGAIACTGCTAYGLASSPPDQLSGGLEANFFYEIGQNDARSLGMAHGGSIRKYINEFVLGPSDVYVITEYQLFGDPSLKIGGYD